jgi:Spherulation-specific family 4
VTGRRTRASGPAQHPAADPPAARPPRRKLRTFPVVVAVLVIAAAIGLTVKLTSHATPGCQSPFVPAFFGPQDWAGSVSGGRSPAVLILNPASGPGTAPDPAFRTAVGHAEDAGTHVIGYIGTNYAQRPLAEAERYVRDYRRWYGVTGIFLDQTPTTGSQQIGYYRSLAAFIRTTTPHATIWLNPGAYPDQSYMSVGNVLMAFEGPYAAYLRLRVPAWAHRYPATRFAHTVYATPGAVMPTAVRLSRQRNAGYAYITDDVGSNPYSALPNYWPRELATIAGGCGAA